MEWAHWRNLCLIGLSVSLLGAQLDVPAEAGSQWQTLAPGMDIKRIQSRQPSMVGDSRITVLRIDPGLWELEVVGIAQTGETEGHAARDWAQKEKYAAVINAGMFEADNKTHLGYLRIRDHDSDLGPPGFRWRPSLPGTVPIRRIQPYLESVHAGNGLAVLDIQPAFAGCGHPGCSGTVRFDTRQARI